MASRSRRRPPARITRSSPKRRQKSRPSAQIFEAGRQALRAPGPPSADRRLTVYSQGESAMEWSRYNRLFESERFGLFLYNALSNTCLLYTSPSPRD